MKILVLIIMFLYVGCTSDPYVVHTLVDKDKNEKVERICTHKTAVIPWYAVVAAGFFTYRYGQECQLKRTQITPEHSKGWWGDTTKTLGDVNQATQEQTHINQIIKAK